MNFAIRNSTAKILLKFAHVWEGPISIVQPVPEKMRLEMVNEMQIEILNGGEI